jgi:hypothetical protein
VTAVGDAWFGFIDGHDGARHAKRARGRHGGLTVVVCAARVSIPVEHPPASAGTAANDSPSKSDVMGLMKPPARRHCNLVIIPERRPASAAVASVLRGGASVASVDSPAPKSRLSSQWRRRRPWRQRHRSRLRTRCSSALPRRARMPLRLRRPAHSGRHRPSPSGRGTRNPPQGGMRARRLHAHQPLLRPQGRIRDRGHRDRFSHEVHGNRLSGHDRRRQHRPRRRALQ